MDAAAAGPPRRDTGAALLAASPAGAAAAAGAKVVAVSPVIKAVAGSLGGVVEACALQPVDVVKTRLQLEGLSSAARHRGGAVGPVLRRIAREEGASALWRGWQPRTLFHAPSAAICWGIYETCKDLLGGAPPA